MSDARGRGAVSGGEEGAGAGGCPGEGGESRRWQETEEGAMLQLRKHRSTPRNQLS